MGNWIWYFIILGAFTVVYGCILWFVIPDSPMKAPWLGERDRTLAVERVRDNRTGIMNHQWKWYQFREAILDPQVWLFVVIEFLGDIPSGGVASYGNIVIHGLGYSPIRTTLLQMPLGAIQGFTIILSGLCCRYFKNVRWIVMILTQIPGLVGAVLLYTLPSSHKKSRLASYYVIQTHSINSVMEYAIATSNVAGTTKKTTTSALIFISFCVGQVAAPQLFVDSEAPRYPTAFKAAFSCFALLLVVPVFLMLYLRFMNKKRDRQFGFTNPYAPRAEADTGDEFLDMTDWEQKSKFRYVY